MFVVMAKIKFNFEKLDVYKKSKDFTNSIYSISTCFPKEEIFGLTSQLRRASVSILLNLAEGSSRTKKDFSRFVDIARGSVFECLAILQIALSQNYIKNNEFENLSENLVEISKMLSGLKNSLI